MGNQENEIFDYCGLRDNFLLKIAVPETHKKGDDWKGRVYDTVWRAHRDVLTGRFHLPEYILLSSMENRSLLEEVYNIIVGLIEKNEIVSSQILLDELYNKYQKVEYGALQKLVNMTLKYVELLEDTLNMEMFPLRVRVINVDCPIDSIILNKLSKIVGKKYKFTWTNMTKDEYNQVQADIRDYMNREYGEEIDNLWFDFLMW